jgi:hypothetical protein
MRVLEIGGHASTPVICVIHVLFLRIPSKTTASYLITYRIQAVQVKFMPALAWKCSMKVKCSKAIRLLLERLRFSKHAVMTYEKRLFRIPLIRKAIHSDLNNPPIRVPTDKHLNDLTSGNRIKREVSFNAHPLVGPAPRTLHCL